MTTDLDDAASELGSHNIGGRACDGQVFSSVMTFGRRVRGTITLSGKKPAPREQREGLNKERLSGWTTVLLVQFRLEKP